MMIQLIRGLSALLFLSTLAFSAQELKVLVQVDSTYPKFRKRIDKELKDRLDQEQSIDWVDQFKVSHQDEIVLHLSYPVVIESGRAGVYVRFAESSKPVHTLLITHAYERWINLNPVEQKAFTEEVAKRIVQQLKVEKGYLQGQKLKPGIYSNIQHIPNRELKVEILDHQASKGQSLVDLLDVEDSLSETTLLEEKLQSDPDALPELSEPSTPAEQYKSIRQELAMTPRGDKRSRLFFDLSKMYLDIEERELAYAYAHRAMDEDPKNKRGHQIIRKVEGASYEPLHRFRLRNRERNLDIRLNATGEWDSNVIQEPVDPFTSTDKEDFVLHGAFSLNKAWFKREDGMYASTQVDAHVSRYTTHHELDLSSTRLGQAFHYRKSRHWEAKLEAGGAWLTRQAKYLLWNAELRAELRGEIPKQDLFWLGEISYTKNTYSNRFFNKEERDGDRYRGGVNLVHIRGSRKEHVFSTGLYFVDENPEDAVLNFLETQIQSQYRYYPREWVTSVFVGLQLGQRGYREAERGRVKREDDRMVLSLGLDKRIQDHHLISLEVSREENDSNRSFETYERDRVSLNYEVKF